MRTLSRILLASALAGGGLAVEAQAHITVNAPNGGEVLQACSVFTISWTVFDIHPPGTNDFELSIDSGATWIPIELGVPTPGGTGVFTRPWCVNNVGSTQCRIKVTNRFAGGAEIDFSDADFTIVAAPGPCVCTRDATAGGTLAWVVDAPGFPGELGVIFSSLTGSAFPLAVVGGVTLQIVPDAWLSLFLGIPPVSQAVLDAMGRGGPVPIPLPNNPGLVGLNVWAAAGIWDNPAGPFVDGTSTQQVQLQ